MVPEVSNGASIYGRVLPERSLAAKALCCQTSWVVDAIVVYIICERVAMVLVGKI